MKLAMPGRAARVKGEAKVILHRSRYICVFAFCVLLVASRAAAQKEDWFRTSTGLGVDKPRLAVADFAAREDPAKPHSQLFTQVVRDDLQFSGIVDLVSPSFYPTQVPTQPSELHNADWTTTQVNANLVAFGNLTESATEVVISAWLYDVRSPSNQAVVGRRNHQPPLRRPPRHRLHANRLRQLAHWHKRTLGNGLRRRQSASPHVHAHNFLNAALVA